MDGAPVDGDLDLEELGRRARRRRATRSGRRTSSGWSPASCRWIGNGWRQESLDSIDGHTATLKKMRQALGALSSGARSGFLQ